MNNPTIKGKQKLEAEFKLKFAVIYSDLRAILDVCQQQANTIGHINESIELLHNRIIALEQRNNNIVVAYPTQNIYTN
jgi:hypothetical protein